MSSQTGSRLHITVRGVVQGVFFRATTRDTASRLGLTGWVRNLPDGESVEIVAEGPDAKLDQLAEWCNHGPPGAVVEELSAEKSAMTGEFLSFNVRY